MFEQLQKPYRALVVGASGGIGGALLAALAADPDCARVIGLSRRSHPGFDLERPETVTAVLQAVTAEAGLFDCIIVATGALRIDGAGPEKTVRGLDARAMARQFAVNAIGPALVLAECARLVPRDRPAVIGCLSARVGSIEDNRLGGWISYRAAKAALNQIVHTAAIELQRSHPLATLVALHPGTVDTPFTAGFSGHDKMTPRQSVACLIDVLSRLTPAESGGFFAYDGQRIPW